MLSLGTAVKQSLFFHLQFLFFQDKPVFMKKLSTDEKFSQMTETPIRPLIIRLAVPTVISNLISTIYNAADTFFIGLISTSASAAVGVAFSLQAIIQAIGFFFGQGSGTTVSKDLGKHDMKDAEIIASTGFFSSFFLSFLIMIPGLIFLEPFAIFLGSTETILPYAKDYMFYILLGSPFMCSSLVLNNQLRFQGYSFYSMIGLTVGGVLNIFLDPLFIFVFEMGIAGAALATALSQAVSFFILLFYALRVGNVRLRISLFRPSLKVLKEITVGGLPSLCRQSVMSVAMIVLNTASKPFGDAAIAAMAIVNKVGNFTNSILLGVGQGFQPVCGYNYGAGLYERVKEGFYFCVRSMVLFLIFLAVLEYIFASQIIEFFRRGDPAVTEIGSLALRLRCFTLWFSSWIVISNMLLQTTGKVVRASILGFARQGIILIPAVMILTPFIGLLGIQLAQPIADIVTIALSIPMTVGVLKSMM